MSIMDQSLQQFSSRYEPMMSERSLQSRESDPIFLGHGRQHSNHNPPFGHIDPSGVLTRITQQSLQSISKVARSPTHADPGIIFKHPQQFGLHARSIAAHPFAQRETKPTVGIERIGCEPLQEIAPGKSEIPIVQGVPALLRRWWRRRWQRDVVHARRTPVPRGGPPFHAVRSIPPGPPSQRVTSWPAPAQKTPPKGMTG